MHGRLSKSGEASSRIFFFFIASAFVFHMEVAVLAKVFEQFIIKLKAAVCLPLLKRDKFQKL